MSQVKKQMFAIRNKEGKFFAGWDADERIDIFKDKHYYLYDLRVAESRLRNIDNAKDYEIVLSPVQDASIWDEPNPYLTNSKK